MARDSYYWQPEFHNVDYYSILSNQIEAFTRKVDEMNMTTMETLEIPYDLYGGGHQSIDCQVKNPFQKSEQFYYMDNFPWQHDNLYSNTYNPGWSNHSNFSWEVPQPPLGFVSQEEEPNLEELLTKFIIATEAKFQNQETSIKNLETQVGQLVEIISTRISETLPIDIEPNPEDVMAITLRSGKELEEKEEEEKEVVKEENTLETFIKMEVDEEVDVDDGTPTMKIEGNPTVSKVMKNSLEIYSIFSIDLVDFIMQDDLESQRKNDLKLAFRKEWTEDLRLEIEPPHDHFKCASLEPFEVIPYELKPD